MVERGGGVRQMPCPDCGSPVRPDVEQLCPRCGYPLMFLRAPAEDDARAVPRAPNEKDDPTGLLRSAPGRADTRQFPAATYGRPPVAPGQVACPRCGFGNEAVRIRCERCGHELQPARPEPVVLGPPMPPQQPHRDSWGWVIALIVLAVLALLVLAGVLVWTYSR
ncbi:zinc ribbon protein [Krasilnikovia cinnamomea]|uniref:Zinc ribbon protein n=1 Tax=Krasilnikovia cinnamomea TaxID=349313 RepID=A0A4Q7ZEC4_9ACTN|nr:zinc-ribbon domain-containing protein [Krasilnikovia cinnamomea]RZU48463.1 zinc ribbon protein [Krasilnikovia cinnamomea]